MYCGKSCLKQPDVAQYVASRLSGVFVIAETDTWEPATSSSESHRNSLVVRHMPLKVLEVLRDGIVARHLIPCACFYEVGDVVLVVMNTGVRHCELSFRKQRRMTEVARLEAGQIDGVAAC